MKKLALLIYLFCLFNGQAQTKTEIENYLKNELKNSTYFKTEYEIKTAKYECEYFLEYKDGNFIFTSNNISNGKISMNKTSVFHEITIAPKDILWQELNTVKVESESGLPKMPFYHIKLHLKPLAKGRVKNKITSNNVVIQDSDKVFEAGKEFMVEVKDLNQGKTIQLPQVVTDVMFKFISAEKDEEANKKASDALFYIFELSKLSGGEEYKP